MLSKYSVIILDEIHERTINTDVLLGLVKGLLKERVDLKVILMSATVDIPKMVKYMDVESVIKVEGRTYPVEVYNIVNLERKSNYIDNILAAIL